MNIPDQIFNWIDNQETPAQTGEFFVKQRPADGKILCQVSRSGDWDIRHAIQSARKAQASWAERTVVARGDLMRSVALHMTDRKREIAEIVALETGKSLANALGETDAAIEMGFFVAGEGRRYYGRTTTASTIHRQVLTVRQPVGVAGLIIASNTPIANVAWKAFPSMLCGNASIMKPSEDTPATAWIFARICRDAGIPPGVFNVVQGYGSEAGPPLVSSPDVDLVSFTGSAETGRIIQRVAGERLAKVCMELGGKNALVVCDDADLELALHWAMQSGFSNAGQRCAAASRIIVFDSIYDRFRRMLVEAVNKLTLGPADEDFLGPVINERGLHKMIGACRKAIEDGGVLLTGGNRLTDPSHATGYYMAPTILEAIRPDADTSRMELFGPIVILYRVAGFDEALALANDSPFGLTCSIHTKSIHRAMRFAEKMQAGVVVINGGTHGSEPHMGFGGVKNSGTGWREAGVEALDVYSEWKYINIITNASAV